MGDAAFYLTSMVETIGEMIGSNDYYAPLETGDDETTLLVDDDGNATLADWSYVTK